MPDPFVLPVDPSYCADLAAAPPACYYVYTTQAVFYIITPVYKSIDLVHWTIAGFDSPADTDGWANGDARDVPAPWADLVGHWAPAVLPRPAQPGARFVMWYAAKSHVAGSAGVHCLGVAVADSPDGPFVDTSTAPAYCQPAIGGTIDPSPFVDTDGTAYLLYKSDGASGSSRLWISTLAPDGRSLVPGTEHLLLDVDHTAGSWEQPIVEAPTMASTPAGLFLFYSAYYWQNPGYKIGVARCDTPVGPCWRVYRTPLVSSRGAMLGPGGQTPFVDSGGQWWMAFHAWGSPLTTYASGGQRMLRILSMTFPGGGPQVG